MLRLKQECWRIRWQVKERLSIWTAVITITTIICIIAIIIAITSIITIIIR